MCSRDEKESGDIDCVVSHLGYKRCMTVIDRDRNRILSEARTYNLRHTI